jgi:hypothetical protein
LTPISKSPANSGRVVDGFQTAWPWRNRQPGNEKSAGGRGLPVRQETQSRRPMASHLNPKRAGLESRAAAAM